MAQRIVKLQVENVKRIQVAEIKPDGNLVIVGGENEAGKTSLLDAIAMAMRGGRAIPDEPIRQGEKTAHVVIQTDKLIVTRKFSKKGTTLEVKGADGIRMTSPQKVLDALIGEISFDPLEFLKLEPKKQQSTLRLLAGVDDDKEAGKRAGLFEERTDVNREAKLVGARLDKAKKHTDVPESETAVVDLLAERDRRVEVNKENGRQRKGLEHLRTTAVELKQQIKALQTQLEEAVSTGKKQAVWVEGLVDQDLADITEQISQLEETNRKVRENQDYIRLDGEFEELGTKSSALTNRINKLDEDRAKRLEEAKLPVEGLGFDDAGITFEGVPFEQVNQAARLTVSVAMGLALNPELRVLLIRDGSCLDKKNLALVAKMAAEADAQIWLERVSDGDECSIIIEDGMVKK